MYNSGFSSKHELESFLYGETCTHGDEKKRELISRQGRKNFVQINYKPDVNQSSVNIVYIANGMPQVAQGKSVKSIPFVPPLGEELVKCRQLLGVSHNDLAEVLKISKQTIINIEKGSSPKPQKKIRNRIEIFLQLLNHLKEVYNNKKYSIRSFLNSSHPSLGESTPFYHMKGGDELSIYDVIGLVIRMKS